MNVAVVEPTSAVAAACEDEQAESDGTSHESEWIDPEGNDWLSSIYWELTHDSDQDAAACLVPELEHWWFG